MADRDFQLSFISFHNLTLLLHMQWQMFRDLYFDLSNQEIFDKSAPIFFNHLNDHLLDLLFLSISRFFDPATQNGYRNVSIEHILSYKEISGISDTLEDIVRDPRLKWEKGIRVWRHKRLSHSDLESYIDRERIPSIPISDVQEIVEAICSFSKAIHRHLDQKDMKYEVYISHWVPDLIRYLRRGIDSTGGAQQDATDNF